MELDEWLTNVASASDTATELIPPVQTSATQWTEIRLFLSSTFIDTQAERDVIIKRVIPNVNRKLAPRFIRINPVDLRWGVLSDESSSCHAIQKTCLNQLDKCRQRSGVSPWFLGLRTQRYGWVQNQVMGSDGFEKPQYYEWIDKFKDSGKQVSITSLECIHAAQSPLYAHEEPTVFFYRRVIENSDDIEEEMRWVFNFEHVNMDKELIGDDQYQYSRNEKADEYQSDKEKLDSFLTTLPHVKYSTYTCTYKEGGARYTCKNEGKKSFGIGYVEDLEEFENQVENDLLQAVEKNFVKPDLSAVSDHVIQTIQHESSMRTKASTFVGRSALLSTCLSHCTSDVGESVMIVHGEPGCGKSGLVATLSQRCLDAMGDEHFVFVHGVDCCPSSNMIENMLKRLHLNLHDYLVKINGTISPLDPQNYDENSVGIDVTSPSNLKIKHLKVLYAAATAHPEKRFVVIVDAANQFVDHLLAWKMWWIPASGAPANLRFVVSTLNKENGTFDNAFKVCPTAIPVPVESMSYEDRQEMVSTVLLRYNKKLTTDSENKLLGNQMDLLLQKNTSPLYLIAAAEALRTFGVFEEVSKYIEELPETTATLFSFLLNEWIEDHGLELIKDVMSLLCVSKDGHLENQINDILLKKEDDDPEWLIYQSSFSRLYDCLINFLASGGGGFLRFFHDQLKRVVQNKFLTTYTQTQSTHRWIAHFFLECIDSQLCDVPSHEPEKAYYKECLDTIVYHQLESISHQEDIAALQKTLRNIYFIRERLMANQVQSLKREYLQAIKLCNSKNYDSTPLKHWSKFVQLYAEYVAQFPQSVYSMAVNQSAASYVSMDTLKLDAPALQHGNSYPLYWKNISANADAALIKYTPENCVTCVTSSHEKNLTCVGTLEGKRKQKVMFFEQDSGILVNQIETRVTSLYLAPTCEVVWVGDKKGFVTVYAIDTVAEVGKILVGDKDKVHDQLIWIQGINDEQVVCGTQWGILAVFNLENHRLLTKWSTQLDGHACFAYQISKALIYSGQRNTISVWGIDGTCVKKYSGLCSERESVVWISPHLNDDTILFITQTLRSSESKLHEWNTETSVGRVVTEAVGDQAEYLPCGSRILCNTPSMKSLRILDREGNVLNKLKGHLKSISHFILVSDVEVLTAASDGSILFELPANPMPQDQKPPLPKVKWCQFLKNGEEFVTLSEDAEVSVWNTSACSIRASRHLEQAMNNHPCAAVRPDGEYICVGTLTTLYWIDCSTLEVASSHRSLYQVYTGKLTLVSMTFTTDGRQLLLLEEDNKCILLLDVSDITKRKKMKPIYTMQKRISWCDVHTDGVRALSSAGHEVHVWNITTGELLHELKTNMNCNMGKFIFSKDQILFKTSDRLGIMDFEGKEIVAFDSSKSIYGVKVVGMGSYVVVSDGNGTLRFFCTSSGEEVYAFFEHRSEGFAYFDIDPINHTIIALNNNGMIYQLKPNFS